MSADERGGLSLSVDIRELEKSPMLPLRRRFLDRERMAFLMVSIVAGVLELCVNFPPDVVRLFL